jgi:glycosyltransferase involved in cell wall biosynthesis
MTSLVENLENWHIAVLIPARNEEDLLPRCLQSVAAARATLPTGVTSDVIVISDCSTDRTVELARATLRDEGVVLNSDGGCVGMARACAAHVALGRHRGLLSRCWLANTDADCEVPATWLLDHLQIARKGYASVAGIVDVHDFSEHLPIVEEQFRRTYRIESDGTHPHVHGANLGVRADAYLMAGGWGTLATAEDHDLWRRLHAGVGPHLSDARLQVITSGRRLGRAPLGFAGALAAHNDVVAA